MEIYVWFCLNSQTNTEFVIIILLRQVAKQTLRSWWWLFKLFFTGISETWFGYIYRGRSNVPTYKPWFRRDLFVLIPTTFGLCFKHTCSGGRNGRLTIGLAVLGIFHLLRDRFISSVPLRQASIIQAEMLKTSRPKGSPVIACSEVTYSRIFGAFPWAKRRKNRDVDGLWKIQPC